MKVGEIFMLGFQGVKIPEWLVAFEKRFGLGGVILFDYSISKKGYDNNIFSKPQLTKLCAAIHTLPSKPMIYIDQEGGKVRRLKDKCGFAILSSQYDMSSCSNTQKEAMLTESYAEMRQIGIDFNLAPVVDAHNSANPNIGEIQRAYAKDISENVLLLNEVARVNKVGICLKHYPGIGDAVVNSHDELMDLTPFLSEEAEALFFDLAPKTFTNAILLSHAFVKQWDEIYPVSISPAAISRIRTKLPDTLLLTDDLQMQGLQQRYSTEEACIKALTAGIDILCIGNNLLDEEEKMIDIASHLEAEIKSNETLRQKYEQASDRIAKRRKILQ